jgi:hypothetical protein
MSTNLTSSRYLAELMGAPMAAIVQAEAMAAAATAQFIREVGFVADTGNTADDALGALRMVTFSYAKMDIDGSERRYTIEMPLLAIVPIPAIQVKQAELDFTLQITGTESSGGAGGTITKSKSAELLASDKYQISRSMLENITSPLKLRAIFGQKPVLTAPTDTGNNKASFNMAVKITLEQSDVPAGLQHLFQIMEKSMLEKEAPDTNKTQS